MSGNFHAFGSFMKTSSNRWRYFVLIGFILSGLSLYLLCFSNLDLSHYFSSEHYYPWQNSVQNKTSVIPKTFLSNIGVDQDYHIFVGSVSKTKPATENPVGKSAMSTVVTLQVTADSTLSPERLEANSTSKSLTVENHRPTSNVVILGELETTTANFGGKTTFPKPNSEDTSKNVTNHERTFSKLLEEFDWRSYDADIKNNNRTNQKIWVENFILKMSYFVALPPIVPINPICTAPPLPSSEQINCSNYPNGFTGIRNNRTAKIGVLIKIGFDVDVLEIHLNEVYDVVDQFFIIESTKTHLKTIPKPLMWEEVKHQERFIKFAPKLTHLIIDDAQNADAFVKTNSDIWIMENLEEKLRWEKFLEWNQARNFFSADDILGLGDADEVPSRRMINMLKYCQLKGGYLDIGIWFPYGNINQAYRTDWPVSGYPYTLGDPTYWTLKTALEVYKSKSQIPSRMRGKAPGFLLGGMHMTNYGYLPFQFVKRITDSEERSLLIGDAAKMYKNMTVDDIRAMELEYGAVAAQFRHRLVNLTTISKEMKDIAILPWFYDCNRDRYPVWEGRRDSRLYIRLLKQIGLS